MLMNLPDELQKEIGAYLDAASLRFFALTSHRSLRNMRSHLIKRQQALLRSPMIHLAAYHNASLCCISNTVYGCGDNHWGQLGLNHINYCPTFTPLITPPGTIQQVVAGHSYILVLTDQGLYGCENNSWNRQLKRGHIKDCTTFTLLTTPPGTIQQVVAGHSCILILTDQGLYRCENNCWDQLRLGGHTKDYTIFTPLTMPPGTIQQVVAGYSHILALTDQGLYGCGDNRSGQLGLNDISYCRTFTPLVTPPGTIQLMAAGKAHTLVLTDQGLYGCGDNRSSQLGLNDISYCRTFTPLVTPPGTIIQQVVAGDEHTLIVTDQGLYGCGNNRSGQLGLGHTWNYNDDDDFCSAGEMLNPIDDASFTPPFTRPLGTIQQVVAGKAHTLVLTDQGLYGCGDNRLGQLGLNDINYNYRTTFTPLYNLPSELRQRLALYHQLDKLIKFNEAKSSVPQSIELLNSSNHFSLK